MPATRTRNHTRQHATAPPEPPQPVPMLMRALDLRPGHAVRLAALGTIPIAKAPERLSGGEILIRLGWERLALTVHPATPLDALGQPAETFRLWHCPRCGGSGLWLPEERASNGGIC